MRRKNNLYLAVMSKPKAIFSLRVSMAAETIVKDQLKTCSKQLNRLKLDNHERLHDLRVELRRLRSYMRMFRLYLPDSCKKDRKQLEHLFQLSNEHRESDVHKVYLTHWLEQNQASSDEKTGMQLLLQDLNQDFKSPLALNFDQAVREVLDAISQKLKLKKASSKDLYCHEFAHKVIKTYHKQLAFYLGEMSQDDASLHKARITAKRLRYFLEALEYEPANPAISELKHWQSELGDIHDLMVLKAYTFKVVVQQQQTWLAQSWQTAKAPKKLPEHLKSLFALRDFIEQHQNLKRKGLDKEKQEALHRTLQTAQKSLKALSQEQD